MLDLVRWHRIKHAVYPNINLSLSVQECNLGQVY